MKALTEKQVLARLAKLSGWSINKKATELSKSYETHSFVAGLAFLARIAVYAEVLQHHPVVEVSFAHVTVTLTTHEATGLTTKDFELAKKIDSIIHRGT